MERNDNKLVNYQLTRLQAALIEWGKQHPHGRVTIVFQDGNPVQALVPTDDGIGIESVLFDKVARQAGLI